MRKAWASGQVIKEKPKGAQEGFELRVTWPAAIANRLGRVKEIVGDRLKYQREGDNRTVSLLLRRKGIDLNVLVSVGEEVHESQVVASVVPVMRILPEMPTVTKESYIEWLSSRDVALRYSGAKALAHFTGERVRASLLRAERDEAEHIYVRLEAAASLARQGVQEGWDWIKKSLDSDFLENQLETVIILGEMRTSEATDLLIDTLLDPRRHAEISSWCGLGDRRNWRCQRGRCSCLYL